MRMQIAHVIFGRPLSAWRAQHRSWWTCTDATTRTAVQLSLVLGGTLVAYHYSLSTLLDELDVQAPEAYVGLVPVFALVLALAYVKPKVEEPDIYDRQVDYIVGIPLILAAAAITMLLPGHMSATFWQWRVDLLAVPLFVAGLLAIVFGVRVLWRQRLAVAYLLLALPALYTDLLASVLSSYTNFTVSALRWIVNIFPVATSVPGQGDAIFTVTHHGSGFPLAVVTACSGVDGLVGFLLIGLLFAAMVRGPLVRKSVWLLSGLPLLWAINLGRIVFIFWAGKEWGETIALDVFHPFVGLVTFSVGVTIWALAHRWAGLRLAPLRMVAAPGGGESPPPQRAATRTGVIAVPRIGSAAILVVVAAIVVGTGDTSLKAYNLVENAVGEPRLTSFLVSPADVPGWSASYLEQFQNGKPEFGTDSLWFRYLYHQVGNAGRLRSTTSVVADVINASGLSGFEYFTIQDCYNFHGWQERPTVYEDLGGGITGQALSYDSQQYGDWSVLFWIWPVQGTIGDPSATRYERVVLYVQDGSTTAVEDPMTGVVTTPAMGEDERLSVNRDFLTAFARQIIRQQKAATSPSDSDSD
jgi:exosortase/archaeosortase family protein